MTTIDSRIIDAVASVEYAADIAEKFISAEHFGEISTKKGSIRSLTQITSDAERGLTKVEVDFVGYAAAASSRVGVAVSGLESDVDRITQDADSAISRIAHFSEEVFVVGSNYSNGRIYFIYEGNAYAPLAFPYVAGASVSDDKALGKLTILQGLMNSDVGEGVDQLATNRKVDFNIKHFSGLSEAISAVTVDPLRYYNIKTTSRKTAEQCAQLGTKYPDGGGASYLCGEAFGIADGASIVDAGIKQLKLVDNGEGIVNSVVFGATGFGDESAIYQSMIDYAIELGKLYIQVDFHHDTPMTLSNRSNVVFLGSGSFAGTNYDTGNYRRQVVKSRAGPAKVPAEIITIDAGKKALTIVITGDSLTTFGPDVNGSDGFYARLTSKIKYDNPDVDFTFFGRGISGQTWAQLDGVPSTSYPVVDAYPWYVDSAKPWLDYISELSPDYVVVSMGMNDRENFSRVKMESAIGKIEAFGSSVILATNFAPCLSPDPSFSQFGTFIGQEGRDYVAGYQRTFAEFYGYPLIDINRTFNIIRDGRDILNTTFASNDQILYGGLSAFVADEKDSCRDFVMECDIDPAAWNNSKPLSIKVGGNVNNLIFIEDNAGFLKFKYYKGDSSPNVYSDVISLIQTPVTVRRCEITVRGSDFYFRFIETSPGLKAGVQPYHSKVIRHGGVFKPSIGYFSTDLGPLKNMIFSRGVEEQFIPANTDIEIWGETNSSIGQKPYTGGNGVQHPSSLGISAVYGEHFKNSSIRFKAEVESDSSLNTSRLYLQTAQVIPSGSNQVLKFAVDYNGLGLIDNGDGTFSNPNAGDYIVSLYSDLPANGNIGYGRVQVSVGSRSSSISGQIDAAQPFREVPVYAYYVPAGSVISAYIVQTTGANMTYGSPAACEIRIVKVS